MLNFDFNTYYKYDINRDEDLKKEIKDKLYNSSMTGWLNRIDADLVSKIKEEAEKVKKHSDCLVVIGIGGSFLGSMAVKEMLTPYFDDKSFKVIYAGNSLSSRYLTELLTYLENKVPRHMHALLIILISI